LGGANLLNGFGVRLYGGTDLVPLSAAITTNQYLKIVVTPAAGKSLDLRGAVIDLEMLVHNSQSARYLAFMTSVDGFTLGDEIAVTPQFAYDSAVGARNPFTFQLPFDSAYSNITGPFEIRLYLYGNQFFDKPVRMSAFKFSGAVN